MRISSLLFALAALGAVHATGCEPGEANNQTEAASSAGAPAGWGPYLLVVNKSSNTLLVLDPVTGDQVRLLEVGFAPHEVAVSTDGRWAYITDYGTGDRPGNTITVVDLERLEVTNTLSLAPHTRPHGVVVASDETVWVTTEGSSHVLQVDPRSGEILQAVETGQQVTHMVALGEEAKRVVTANIGSGTATIVDLDSHTVLFQVDTGAGAEGLAVHPDGLRAYVTNRGAGTLVEVDLMTGAITRSLAVGDFPIRVKVRPGGEELLVSNSNGNEIVAVGLEDWTVLRRLPVGTAPVGILITPDNRMAYVANTRDDKLTVIDLEQWMVSGEISTGDEPDGMAWVQ